MRTNRRYFVAVVHYRLGEGHVKMEKGVAGECVLHRSIGERSLVHVQKRSGEVKGSTPLHLPMRCSLRSPHHGGLRQKANTGQSLTLKKSYTIEVTVEISSKSVERRMSSSSPIKGVDAQ